LTARSVRGRPGALMRDPPTCQAESLKLLFLYGPRCFRHAAAWSRARRACFACSRKLAGEKGCSSSGTNRMPGCSAFVGANKRAGGSCVVVGRASSWRHTSVTGSASLLAGAIVSVTSTCAAGSTVHCQMRRNLPLPQSIRCSSLRTPAAFINASWRGWGISGNRPPIEKGLVRQRWPLIDLRELTVQCIDASP